MATIEELTETIVKFRDERDWAQFHNAKDLSLALSIEAAELNQLFLWKSPEEANVEKIKEELADVLNYVQSPNQKIPDRKTKCVIKTHINIKQNVIFGAKLKPV